MGTSQKASQSAELSLLIEETAKVKATELARERGITVGRLFEQMLAGGDGDSFGGGKASFASGTPDLPAAEDCIAPPKTAERFGAPDQL